MSDDPPQPISTRDRVATYATGLSCLGLVPMMTVAVPLWALQIGASPAMIGLALGARALLSVPFSIHGGALMDRIGPRRIMIGSALINTVLLPLYPVLPWIVPLIALQTMVGFTQGLAWMGAQTRISLMARREPHIVGRFTFVSTLGNVIGPPIVGAAWDGFGPWGAFATLGLWSAGALVVLMSADSITDAMRPTAGRVAPRDIVPRAGDYAAAFRMALVPTVGFVVTCSFLMTWVYSIRHSFYTVYLDGIGLSGTLIGVLFAVGSTVSSFSGLTMAAAARRIAPNWLLLLTMTVAVTGMMLVPLADSFAPLLALAVFWGMGSGISFPLTLSVLSRLVGTDQQGMVVGLRTTMNRAAGFITPVAMGAIAGATEIATSFFVVGGSLLVCLALLALFLSRRPDLARAGRMPAR